MKKYNTSLSGKIFKCFNFVLLFFFACSNVGWGQTIQIQNNQAYGDYWWTYPCGSGGTRAQSFTTGSSPISVTSIDVDLKYDSYSGNVSYEIWSNNNNGTTGTLSDDYPSALIANGASNSLAISSGWTTYGLRSCTFTTSPILSANTKYWIIVKTTATNILVGYSTANASPWDIEENAKSTGTTCAAWTAAAQASQDILFDIYGTISGTNYYWNGSNTSALNGTWNTSSNLWSTPTKTTTLTNWPSASGSYIANFSSCGSASTVTLPGTIAYAPVNTVLGNSNHTFTSSATATLSSPINIGSYVLKMSPNASYPITLSGIISGTGSITNTTGTTILSGTNTYTGATTVTSGTIKLGNSAALGTTAGSTSVTSGAVLDLNGTAYSTAEPLTLNGTGISSGGALINSSSTAATFAGPITLGSASSIVGGTGSITISGTVTNATYGLTLGGATGGTASGIISGTGALTKADAGAWTLSAANTYTGTTTISAGTLTLGAANALPITTSAGTIQFAGSTPILNLGLYNLGSSTASANSAGQLDFDVNTTVNLGASGTNAYYFKASNGQTWSATTVTIYNWTGIAGVSGTGPKIYVGSDATGLSATQLAKITFNGYSAGAIILSTGEVVPAPPAPTITSLGTTSGCAGSSLTINGTNLTGATAANVKVGGTAVSSITLNTGTVMVVVVGAGTTGTIAVTTAGGTATSASTYTVNPSPTISGTTTVCPSTTTTLTGSITPGTWGSSNTGIATVNSSGVVTGAVAGNATITYTVTATGCTATASVTVSTAPSAVTVTPSSATVCSGGIQSLVASGGTVGSSFTIGTGTTYNSTTAYPSPYTNYYGGTKHQMLILASELTAAGMAAGSINSISFYVKSVGSSFSGSLLNFQINMKNTSTTALSSSSFE